MQHTLPHIESCFLNYEEFVSESQAIVTFRNRKTGYNLATFFSSYGDLNRSELLFKRIIFYSVENDPKLWIKSLRVLSVVLIKSSRFQEAIELLTEALNSLPGPPLGTWRRKKALGSLHYFKESISDQ
ncbi:hypothetical protein BHYA_0091g00240 [Botrytis hyacinthi]|uniref:Uncharacterized protein n=1 Tax=Botrytis hyacinthi TaxID=278943 RepID=A0A4Z1GQI6_9HELO|nr:hypothetical protein BHYA_0091g00240 [Botrytis hyacinthi]